MRRLAPSWAAAGATGVSHREWMEEMRKRKKSAASEQALKEGELRL